MQTMELTSVCHALQQDTEAYMKQVEQIHWETLHQVAEEIIQHRKECPILLLAGPSGSGKTITAMMIESILDQRGFETHTLSMDHYFKSMSEEQHLLAEAGKLDLETPERLDLELLNAQMRDIRDGKPVPLPKYDFRTTKRVPSGRILCRKPQELVILEGIHALNPEVTMHDGASRMYVNVQTELLTASGQTISPAYVRLLRRIIRDQKYRKRTPADTIRMMASVQSGEERFITPFCHTADYSIDTFLPYEPFAYYTMLKPSLSTMETILQVPELAAIFTESVEIPVEQIPNTALIREFIGGSIYYGA